MQQFLPDRDLGGLLRRFASTLVFTLAVGGCGQITISGLDALQAEDIGANADTVVGGDVVADAAETSGGGDGIGQDTSGDNDVGAVDGSGDVDDTGDPQQDVDADADAADPDSATDATDTVDVPDAATACQSNDDCSAPTPACEVGTGTCIACLVDAHCPTPHARCEAGTCLAPQACDEDEDCAASKGVCAAFDFCVDCTADSDCPSGAVCKVFQCVPKAGGCSSAADCAGGEVCAEGLCTPPVCKAGDSLCLTPTALGACAEGGSGWDEISCGDGNGCDQAGCSPFVCPPGAKACAGDAPTYCPANGQGWQLGAACTGDTKCVDGVCSSAACQPGETQCGSNGKLQTCNAQQTGWVDSDCPTGQACSKGVCLNVVCAPKAGFCVGETVWLCNASGTSKTFVTDCSSSGGVCAEGSCQSAPCKAGDVLCKGDDRLLCKDGTAWVVEACSGQGADKCQVSACDAATKTCKSGATKSCDDGNPCTEGTCEKATGDCKQTPLGVAGGAPVTCDDGNGCTQQDICAGATCALGPNLVETIAGAKIPGFLDGPADKARFSLPVAVARRPTGQLVVADRNSHRLRQVALDGSVSTLAGNGSAGYADGPAATAMLSSPSGVAVAQGWVLFSDRNNHRIRRVSPTGQVTTLAGSGQAGDQDGKGVAAQLYFPEDAALDGKGMLYVVEPSRHRIRRVDPEGNVLTIAGSPTAGQTDGKGIAAQFNSPSGIDVTADGLLFVADLGNARIRVVGSDGTVGTVAGSTGGFADGPAATAKFNGPRDVLYVPGAGAGSPYLVVADSNNRLLRRVALDAAQSGKATTVDTLAGLAGKSGNKDGPVAEALFTQPWGLWREPGGVGICDASAYAVRRFRAPVLSCDDGDPCTTDSCDGSKGACVYAPIGKDKPCDDGNACTASDACGSAGGCVGTAKVCDDGNACTVDSCNPWTGACVFDGTPAPCDDGAACTWGDHCQDGACVSGLGWVETVAGSGSAQSVDGVGASASFTGPSGLLGAADGTIWVADREGHRIRRFDPKTATVTTVAGSTAGYVDAVGEKARFNQPKDLAPLSTGGVLVTDSANHRIRAVKVDGTTTTFAGDGAAGFVDGPVATARFQAPEGIAADAAGTVYVADTANRRIRRIQSGQVTTLAGSGVSGMVDGTATAARFALPTGLLLDGGTLLVADRDNHRIRAVSTKDGATATWLGSGQAGFIDGDAVSAALGWPVALHRGPDARLWVASLQGRIFEVRGAATKAKVRVVSGSLGGGMMDGPLQQARYNQPRGLLANATGVYISDAYNRRLRLLTPEGPACAVADGPCGAAGACDEKTGTCKTVTPKDGAACEAGVCSVGACKAGACVDAKPKSCDDGKPCTADLCDGKTGGCVHTVDGSASGCCKPEVWTESFESFGELDADPVSQGSVWHLDTPSEAGLVKSGKKALRFGVPGGAISQGGGTAIGYVRLPPFVVPVGTGSVLTVPILFTVQPMNTLSRAYVYLRYGTALVSLGTAYASKAGWQTVTRDLTPLAGRTVQVEIRAQHSGSVQGAGIFVDDIALTADCTAPKCGSNAACAVSGLSCWKGVCSAGACQITDSCCLTAADCDDGKPCTIDACNNGNCSHAPKAGCCESDTECGAVDVCLAGTCDKTSNSCLYQAKEGCCHVDADCDDGKPCTQDFCGTDNACTHKEVCCKVAADCNDGLGCSTEACNAGWCSWTFKQASTCCKPFDGNEQMETLLQVADWTRQNCSTGSTVPTGCSKVSIVNTNTQGWQYWGGSGNAHGGKGVLYYGDPKLQNFSFGARAESLTSPPVKVGYGKSELEGWIYWDTEPGTNYDRLLIWLLVDGQRINVGSPQAPFYGAFWVKGSGTATQPKTWTRFAVDVSAYVGKKVQLEILFNTVDSAANTGLGVMLDDVRLVGVCSVDSAPDSSTP